MANTNLIVPARYKDIEARLIAYYNIKESESCGCDCCPGDSKYWDLFQSAIAAYNQGEFTKSFIAMKHIATKLDLSFDEEIPPTPRPTPTSECAVELSDYSIIFGAEGGARRIKVTFLGFEDYIQVSFLKEDLSMDVRYNSGYITVSSNGNADLNNKTNTIVFANGDYTATIDVTVLGDKTIQIQ